MREIIKLAKGNGGFVYLFESANQPPMQIQHTHRELELNVVVSGTASYLLPGRKYTLQKGSIVWLFPEHLHMISERSKNFAMYVIVFSKTLVKKHTLNLKYKPLRFKEPQGDFCRSIDRNKFDLISSICSSICSENPDTTDKNPLKTWAGSAYGYGENKVYNHQNIDKLNSGLGFLLLEAWDSFEKADEQAFNELHPSVETAYLKLNNQENYPAILEYNLDALAQECHLSPARLSRLFHAQIGTTLILYRNQKRLEYFQQIYSSSPHLTISEAAFSAGFGSYAQFQKSFIKAFGYSPKSFKDKVRR